MIHPAAFVYTPSLVVMVMKGNANTSLRHCPSHHAETLICFQNVLQSPTSDLLNDISELPKKRSTDTPEVYLSSFIYSHLHISVPNVRAVYGEWLWPIACWDCGFEFRRGHECLFLVTVVCCQVEVSAMGRFLFQRSPTDCVVSLCVIYKSQRMRRPWPKLSCYCRR